MKFSDLQRYPYADVKRITSQFEDKLRQEVMEPFIKESFQMKFLLQWNSTIPNEMATNSSMNGQWWVQFIISMWFVWLGFELIGLNEL